MGRHHNLQRPNILCLSGGLIQETEENCLHLACRFNAPFSIIERLCAISPELVSECSSQQKATPLHVAVSNKTVSIEVVNFLLSQNVNMSSVKDVNMCTPLHLICRITECGRNLDPYEDSFITYPALACQEEVSLVIKALCEVYPWYINDEDNFGITPIEYAIESKLEYSLIKYMWTISSIQWKRQQECTKKVKRAFSHSYSNQIKIPIEDSKNIKLKTSHDLGATNILSESQDQSLYPRQQVTRRPFTPFLFADIGSTHDTVITSDEDTASCQSLIGMVLETAQERKQRRRIHQRMCFQ
jgi:ankyrin repeat protein